MDVVSAIAQAVKSLFDFLTKTVPPDEIRQDIHDRKKPRLEQEEKIKILNREFKRLKNRTEIDIKISVAFVNDNLNEEDQKELIELLTAMVTEYRKKHPIIFRKWLKKNNIK
jgi:hypothetical protein